MFSNKKKYYFIIESIKDIDLKKIKKRNKFSIVYRNHSNTELTTDLIKFRKECKLRSIDFYVANNYNLAVNLSADGIYISAFNKDLSLSRLKHSKLRIIGSAHNFKELNIKITQGCKDILFSRIFKTSYVDKPNYFGITKYNLLTMKFKHNLVPLGGIRLTNLNKLKITKCNAFAILSEVKKKPAIISRLF